MLMPMSAFVPQRPYGSNGAHGVKLIKKTPRGWNGHPCLGYYKAYWVVYASLLGTSVRVINPIHVLLIHLENVVKFWFVDIAMKFVHILNGLTRAESAFCNPCVTRQDQWDTLVCIIPFPHAGPVLSATTRAVGWCNFVCVSNTYDFPHFWFMCSTFVVLLFHFVDMFDMAVFLCSNSLFSRLARAYQT